MQKSSQGLVISKAPITSIGIYTPEPNKHHTIQYHYDNFHVRKGSYYQQDHSHDTTLRARNATKSPLTLSSKPTKSIPPQSLTTRTPGGSTHALKSPQMPTTIVGPGSKTHAAGRSTRTRAGKDSGQQQEHNAMRAHCHKITAHTQRSTHNTDAGWQHSRPEVTPDAHHHRRARIQDARRRTKHPHARTKAAVSSKNATLDSFVCACARWVYYNCERVLPP